MAQHPRKLPHEKTAERHAFRPAEAAQDAGKKAFTAGHESLMHGTQGYINLCANNLDALAASGSTSAGLAQEFGREILECNNRAFSDFADLAEAALACKTINDVIDLQNRATQQWSDNYFETTNRLWHLAFDRYTQVMKPLSERTTAATSELQRTMAA